MTRPRCRGLRSSWYRHVSHDSLLLLSTSACQCESHRLPVVGVQILSPQSRGGSRRSDAEHYPAYRAFTGVAVFREPRNFRKLSFEMKHRPKSVATAKNEPP